CIRCFGPGGEDDVMAGEERKRADDGAEASADSIADHGVAHSLSNGEAEPIAAQPVRPEAEREQTVLAPASAPQDRDEVLASPESVGPRPYCRRRGRHRWDGC